MDRSRLDCTNGLLQKKSFQFLLFAAGVLFLMMAFQTATNGNDEIAEPLHGGTIVDSAYNDYVDALDSNDLGGVSGFVYMQDEDADDGYISYEFVNPMYFFEAVFRWDSLPYSTYNVYTLHIGLTNSITSTVTVYGGLIVKPTTNYGTLSAAGDNTYVVSSTVTNFPYYIRLTGTSATIALPVYIYQMYMTVSETIAPTNPTSYWDISPATSTWSTSPSAYVAWNAGADTGSGVYGYSRQWSTSSTTVPTATPVVQLADNSPTLADGITHYLHVRSVDNDGNWATGAYHIGPFWIDATAPTNPSSISSATPAISTWSADNTIAVTWNNGADATSGVYGYSIEWSTASNTLPDTNYDLTGTSTTSTARADGIWYLHIRTRDYAGNWASTAYHVGPFWIDATAPTNPSSIYSASPAVSTWSIDNTVDVAWNAGADATSGVHGYSIEWSTSSTTIPDTSEDTTNAYTTSSALADGNSHYLHIRTQDRAGNWATSAYHIGPFWIDATAPTNPSSISSASPAVSTWSADNTVAVTWNVGADATTGVHGYSIEWSTSSTTIPNTSEDTTGTSTTSSVLTDGNSHYLHIRTQDNVGNWASTAYHVGPFWIDATAPTNPSSISSASPAVNTWSNDNTVDVAWNAGADATSGVHGYSIEWSTSSGTIPNTSEDTTNAYTTSSALADGNSHYLHIRTQDLAGNWATSAYHIGPFWIDTVIPTNPLSTVSTDPATSTWSTDNTVDVTWNAGTDDFSAVSGYSIEWSTSADTIPDTVQDTTETSTTSSTLADGNSHYIHIRTRDNAGNWATGAYHIGPFYIDVNIPANPSSIVSASPAVSTWSSDNTVAVQWNNGTDGGSGVHGYSIEWSTSAGTIPDTVEDTAGTSATSGALADGDSHYLHIRTQDNMGNWTMEAYHIGPFWIDTVIPTNPLSTVSTDPTTSTWSTDNTVTVQWNDGTDGGSGVHGYSIEWSTSADTIPDTVEDTTSTSTTSSPLAESNSWYLHIKTLDAAGNYPTGAYHVGPFYIDMSAPANPSSIVSASPAASTWSIDNTVDVEWSVGTDGGSGVHGYSIEWSTSAGTIPDMVEEMTGTSNTSSVLADGGSHYLHVRTQDNLGNWATDAYHIGPFCIDTVAPTNPSSGDSSPPTSTWSTDNTVGVEWNAGTDATSGVHGYSIEWSTSASTIPDTVEDMTTTSTTSSPLAEGGSWYIHIRAQDSAGNWATDAYHVGPFYIDGTLPNIISPTAVQYVVNTTGNTITWTISDLNPGTLVLYKDGSIINTTSWMSGTPIVTNIDGLAEGIYNYTIMVTDGVGNTVSRTVLVTVTVTSGLQEYWIYIIIVAVGVAIGIVGSLAYRKKMSKGRKASLKPATKEPTKSASKPSPVKKDEKKPSPAKVDEKVPSPVKKDEKKSTGGNL